MHSGRRILVLPNAWDAMSACIFARAGFPAIATTSAGVAAVLGYPDGEVISKAEMLQIARRIAATVDVPVTADIESAYAATSEGMAETVREAIGAGLAGVNIEDSKGEAGGAKRLADIAFQLEVIHAVREVAAQAGIPLVLNARTDGFLYGSGDVQSRLRETIRRANAYREAGADCLFPIAVKDADAIRQLVREINGPVNILAGPGLPSVSELQDMGVARVTFGSGLMRGTFPLIQHMAEELLASGTYNSFTQAEYTHIAVNEMLKR
jgi:2-methylisocitrate lyase-like PEP mutase family enzyme